MQEQSSFPQQKSWDSSGDFENNPQLLKPYWDTSDQWTKMSLCVTANISSGELTAPATFPAGSEATMLRVLSRHQEWGKWILNIPPLFCSLHPALRWEPFAKLEHAQALPLNTSVRKVPCPVPEAASEMCWAVQLLVGHCFQRNRVYIMPQVTNAISSHSGTGRRSGPSSSSREGSRHGEAKQVLQVGRFGVSNCLAPWIPVLCRGEGDRPWGTNCLPAHATAVITVTAVGHGQPGRIIPGKQPQHAGKPPILSPKPCCNHCAASPYHCLLAPASPCAFIQLLVTACFILHMASLGKPTIGPGRVRDYGCLALKTGD